MEEKIKDETSESEKQEDGGAKSEAEKQETDIDTLLKKERERGFSEGIAFKAFKNREEKREEKKSDETEQEEEKPITKKELGEILRTENQKTRKEIQSSIISDKARKLAKSDKEAELIVEIHKNRIFPEGLSLDEQLEEARAIAHSKPEMKAFIEESSRANNSKETANDNSAGTHRDSNPLDEPKITSADITAIKGAGFVWDGKTQTYRKELKNRIIIFDPKTKQNRVIQK